MKDRIAFRTAAQAAIFELEITGQLSDGYWENDPRSYWRVWCNAEVAVAEPGETPSRNFPVNRDSYRLDHPDLLEVVGYRMRVYAVLARCGYSLDEVRLFEHLFDLEGKWSGIPIHKGDYYDDIRERLGAWGLDLVRRQVEKGLPSYPDKRLRADLREMKIAMRTER